MVPRPNVPSDINNLNIMQVQPQPVVPAMPVPAASTTPPLPADCLSQQPCQATAQRGPHDFAASWKVGTTDRSAAAAGGVSAQTPAQPQPQQPNQQVSENGNGAAAGAATTGSVSNQMGISTGGGSGNGGSGTSSSILKKVTSLEQLSQALRIGGDRDSSKKTPAAGSPALSAVSAPTSSGGDNGGGGEKTSPAAASAAAGTTLPERPHTTSPPLSAQASANTGTQAPASPPLFQSQYQERLFNQPSDAVEAVLAASCDVMGFDIAEMWLRTGPKTHQLTNSHLRPTALEDSVRAELVDVYYGEMSSRRTHRLSPALCKRAKEAQDVVWVTANTERGAEALRCSISDVRTAVAVPVCHESSSTNITLIYFSIRRAIMRPQAVEFLVHMSLSAAVASINSLAEDVMVDVSPHRQIGAAHPHSQSVSAHIGGGRSESYGHHHGTAAAHGHPHPPLHHQHGAPLTHQQHQQQVFALQQQQQRNQHQLLTPGPQKKGFSVTGACLDLKWNSLKNVEYLTDGGNNWIHTAVMGGRPVVVKTLKPECQDLALAINEIEGELEIHAQLDHPNIVGLVGAGTTSKGSRFVVLERLDGGTLTQHLGYDTRIRDRRRRFWKKKQFSYLEVLSCAKSVADAMAYCHAGAIPGSMVLHRDLKPDNIGFTLDGTVKLIGEFRLASMYVGVVSHYFSFSFTKSNMYYSLPLPILIFPYV